MQSDNWYDIFIESLYKKYPKKTQLTKALMDLLCIEREAVYRRLRKDVIFPADEIIKIASSWNISLDGIIDVNLGTVPFQLIRTNYLNPSTEEMDTMRKRVQNLEHFKTTTNSEYMVVSNNISRSLAVGFEYIYKFNIFKWAYLYGYDSTNVNFSQIVLPEKVYKEIKLFSNYIKYVTNTSYIFEFSIFEHFVREVQFFHSIMLVTDEEKDFIKKDLHALLDYLLLVATTGCFPETKNKVQIYVSMININTNYSYFYTDKLKTCRIHAFNMHDICTHELEMVERFKVWMQLKKRTCIQISETDEKSRIEFFKKQRDLVDSL